MKIINTYEDILELENLGEFDVYCNADKSSNSTIKKTDINEALGELIICVTINRFGLNRKQAELLYNKACKVKRYSCLADLVYYIEDLGEMYIALNRLSA